MSELIGLAGLASDNVWIGDANDPLISPFSRKSYSTASDLFGLDACCERELNALVGWANGTSLDERHLARALGHGMTIAAFGAFASRTDRLNTAVSLLRSEAKQAHRSALTYLEGIAALNDGRFEIAQDLFETSRRTDAELIPPVIELATLASDRGDVNTARTLLQTVGDSSAEIELLRQMSDPFPGTGRNEPCPCGSGRKFKTCCQNKSYASAEQRRHWLQLRAIKYALESIEGALELDHLAFMAFDSPATSLAEHQRLFLLDVALFEGGGLRRFRDERGPLWEDGDRRLVDIWLAGSRSLWEVVDTTPGETITLRDTRAGNAVTFTERTASKTLEKGEYLFGRVVDEPGGPVMFGEPLRINIARRRGVLDLLDAGPSASDIARWFGALHAAPSLQNTDGQQLQFCVADIRVDENDELIDLTLDEFFEPDDSGWTYLNDESTVLGHIEREGDLLKLSANSTERLAALMVELEEMGIEHETLEVRIEDPEDLMTQGSPQPVENATDDLMKDPEVLAAVDAHMRTLERKWIDEPVPALGGLTPRQASEDPTRREDLEALLRDMDRLRSQGPGHGGFVADRIREMLGI